MNKTILSLICLQIAACACPALANESATPNEAEEVAKELANPLAPVTTLLGQVRIEADQGPEDDTNYQLRLQPAFFKPLEGQSAALLRTIVPFLVKDWPTEDEGLGDITLAPYYVPNIYLPTFIGFGGAFGFPTATADALGSKKYTAGPALIVAKTGMPLTYGGLVQHIWSYAGDDKRPDISSTTIQPFLTCLLGSGWSTTLNTEASYNWEAGDDRWTIPLALGVAKVVRIGSKYVNIGAAAVDYVEGPQGLPGWEARFSATYVFK